MNTKAFASAAAVLGGIVVFVLTLASLARGTGRTLTALAIVFPGYAVTYLGSVIGLVCGAIAGAILGALFCWLYNKLGGAARNP
jgi:hypothetical protein